MGCSDSRWIQLQCAIFTSRGSRAPTRFGSVAMLPAWRSILIFVFARQGGTLSRALSHRIAVRLGEISFGF
jgi:peptidoglycan/LPS O-acetylase OafA/YrhL